MEYAQITMDEYMGIKKDIQENITNIAKSFVRIGQMLYKVEQSKAYEIDGYKTLAEFAKAEYGMTASGVSRFVKVYKKYCEGNAILQEYEDYTYAQLVEMLNLPEEDQQLIRPDTSREDIRSLKRFNREGENDIHRLENWKNDGSEEQEQSLKEMLKLLLGKEDRENDFNAICQGIKDGSMTEKEFSEIVNPSGNKTIRNGRTMAFLFENEIRIKIWGQDKAAVFSYQELMECFKEVFQDVLEGESGWWRAQFSVEEKKEEVPVLSPELQEKPEIAPAQNLEGNQTEDKAEVPFDTEVANGKERLWEESGDKKEPKPESKTEPINLIEEEKEPEEEQEPMEPFGEESKKPEKDANEVKEQQAPVQEEDQIEGQDSILSHKELLPDGYDVQRTETEVKVDGEPVKADVEPTDAQRKKRCEDLFEIIKGNFELGNYPAALKYTRELCGHLEEMGC